jgi:predicted methyltransferase
MRRTLALALLSLTLLGCKIDGSTSSPGGEISEAELARLESPERDAWAKPDEVVAALPLGSPDMDVADIGAGSGYFTRRLARRVPEGRVFAVDVAGTYKHYILENRETWGTPNIETRLALYENPLLPQDSLDLVFLSNTYRYIQERVTYFRGVHDSLRAGGKLVVISFRVSAECEALGEMCPPTEERVSADSVVSELGEAGFVLATREKFLEHQYMLVFARAADREGQEAAASEPPEPTAPPTPDAAN